MTDSTKRSRRIRPASWARSRDVDILKARRRGGDTRNAGRRFWRHTARRACGRRRARKGRELPDHSLSSRRAGLTFNADYYRDRHLTTIMKLYGNTIQRMELRKVNSAGA